MTESCVACGCEVSENKSPGAPGAGLRHGEKWYCMECAGMILPPEELERLSKSAPARPAASVLSGDDDVLGQEVPTSPENPTPDMGTRIPRDIPAAPRQQPGALSGKRKAPTRSPSMHPPSSGSSSSRRGVSPSSRRDSSVTGVRGDRAERDTPAPRENSRARKRAADSMGLYISMGVGALALMLVMYFVFMRKAPEKPMKPKPNLEFVDTDKTPSTEYARRAEEFLQKKDLRNAVLMYGKAADRAEKEGDTQKAKEYNMRSVSIEKSSTLK